jgi:hypothetical protein
LPPEDALTHKILLSRTRQISGRNNRLYVRPADKRRVTDAMAARGLRQLRFRFDDDGARIVANLHRS